MQPRDKFFTALLAIRSTLHGGSGAVEVVSTGERLTASAMDALRTKLMAGAQRGAWRYVVDLTRVKKMDSPGLGLLVGALRTIGDVGGIVALVTGSPKLQRVLELCARSRTCRIYPTSVAALSALRDLPQPKTAA